jgi:formamidase
MPRILTVLGAQVRPVAFDRDSTLEKFEREVAVATQSFPSADLLVFPELYLAAEDPFTSPDAEGYAEEVAEPIPGPTSERAGKVAQRAGRFLVAGSIFERADERIFNTALVLAPDGGLVARYRKLFPWRPWERSEPGDSFCVFELPGVGRLGLMTCYDGWFPEVARGLALRGAEAIVQPSLTSTPDREEELLLARATAIVNQCFVINVNATSTLGGGRSIAVDPEGRVLFQAGAGEELILEVMDLDRTAIVRERGTRGLNRVWQHFLDAPRAIAEAYVRPEDAP